jgi:hypothetical protein
VHHGLKLLKIKFIVKRVHVFGLHYTTWRDSGLCPFIGTSDSAFFMYVLDKTYEVIPVSISLRRLETLGNGCFLKG